MYLVSQCQLELRLQAFQDLRVLYLKVQVVYLLELKDFVHFFFQIKLVTF